MFQYPTEGDVLWGSAATNWAVAVSSGLLQKSGGLFSLTSNLDFGPSGGLKSIFYGGRGLIASAGLLRLGNNESINWRNAANTADASLKLDASNNLVYNTPTVANAVVVDTTGNVGIGNSALSPWHSSNKALQIGVSGFVRSKIGNELITVGSGLYDDGTNWRYSLSGNFGTSYQQASGEHSWYSAPVGVSGNIATLTERMRIDSAGNVGIGTNTTVSSKLQITKYDITGGSHLEFSNRGTNTSHNNTYEIGGIYASAFRDVLNPAYVAGISFERSPSAGGLSSNGAIIFKVSDTGVPNKSDVIERMRITTDGNVGIGTSTPLNRFHILQDISGQLISKIQNPSLSGGASASFELQNGLSNAQIVFVGSGNTGLAGASSLNIINNAAAPMAFYTNSIERMRILPNGNICVGVTTGSSKLTVMGNSLFSSTAGVTAGGLQNADSTALDGQYIVQNHITGTASASRYIYFGYAAGEIGSISQNGTTGVSYNTSSDYRLKLNQLPLQNSGSFIDALKPKTWIWKDGTPGSGFVAHEFQEVSPSSVTGAKDAVKEDGTPDYQSMQASSAEVMANIIAELQSLRARIKELE